ncbi:N-acetylated-alpha-linked acidic dipeptidase [Pelobates cultripes]|uniref:Aminopeptidase NAALADL1 n=1 Tax=Pelobates cultripes TaxID=61616 RepID=A0AAD1VNL8_PELCU|nr:N-acetylated-alpha-linked acidic dipeptidase [Pelobates cultripes]
MNWWKVAGGILGGGVILAIGLLIGHFGISKDTKPQWVKELYTDLDEEFIKEFMKEVDNKRIEENLRALSEKPHVATSQADEDLVQLILSRWRDPQIGLDEVKEERYDVFLSFPDSKNPNNVAVVRSDGSTSFTSQYMESPLTDDQKHPDILQPFLAYAPNGTVTIEKKGSNPELALLVNLAKTIDLNGTIAIVRYGGIGRVNKAINAEKFGVIGVIIYTDPKNINDGKSDPHDSYPNSWYLPPSGVERGSFKENFGDQLTPYYPAKDFTYRIPESQIKGISNIPAQPIGYEDAKQLICNLSGSEAPWQGSLGCTYNTGPGFVQTSLFSNSDVQINVYNKRTIKSSANVMGFIRGAVEPDRYIMYGNHRDSWVHGAIDPSSGTAVMLEITRVLGRKLKEGKWRPRRSIIFGSWGAEEFGLIGSTEFAEEYYSKLRDRTAAYINVDIAVFANASLRAQGTPPAQSVIFAASKQVKIPGDSSLTVYENWKNHFNRDSPHYGLIPQMHFNEGSVYGSVIHYTGSTSNTLEVKFTNVFTKCDYKKTSARIYPAYHTAFDTFDYASKYIDPGFTSHQTVARTAGNVLLRLSDSIILPLGARDYVELLENYYNEAEKQFLVNLNLHKISLEPLKTAINRYKTASETLEETIQNLKETDETPLRIRMVNDQLMLLERAFTNSMAFPNRLYFSHVLWATRSSSFATFPGLADAYQQATETDTTEDWHMVHHQLTIAIQAVESAASTLELATKL